MNFDLLVRHDVEKWAKNMDSQMVVKNGDEYHSLGIQISPQNVFQV